MSRQLTISRTELGLPPLALNDPTAGYFLSDEWKPGSTTWHRYSASSSAWVHGDRTVAQRKLGTDEIFTVYIHGDNGAALTSLYSQLAAALGQFRYTFTIDDNGFTNTYTANGAGDITTAGGKADPMLSAAGWRAYEITIPRNPS